MLNDSSQSIETIVKSLNEANTKLHDFIKGPPASGVASLTPVVPVAPSLMTSPSLTATRVDSPAPVDLSLPVSEINELDLVTGGKFKKRSSKSKKHGGSYNLPAMYNVDGLISAGNDPVTAASVHVGTMMNTPSPFSSGMNTDFNDSTRTIPKAIIQNVVPKVGVTQTGGRRSKPKSKASKRT